jgi:glycosyltransferase involved in cell wall biosynthesis
MLEALAQFRTATGTGRLWLAGSGSERYQRSLAKLARRLHLEDHVTFWGRVPEQEKFRLMGEAHLLLMTSVREGWGLVVTEASACGTPAIVYDVPGLRDAVINESTGLVVTAAPTSLSKSMIRLTSDHLLYDRLAAEGKRWSATFSFDEAARIVTRVVETVVAA